MSRENIGGATTMGRAHMAKTHQRERSGAPACSLSTSTSLSHTRINNSSPPYPSTTDSSRVTWVGEVEMARAGSPKNQVEAMSSLSGELGKEPPAKSRHMAKKPTTAGCQRNSQPSKGPGRKRPSGV